MSEHDVVDCEECGHDILSAHHLDGCEQGDGVTACPCPTRWTREDKRKLARDYDVRQTGIR